MEEADCKEEHVKKEDGEILVDDQSSTEGDLPEEFFEGGELSYKDELEIFKEVEKELKIELIIQDE